MHFFSMVICKLTTKSISYQLNELIKKKYCLIFQFLLKFCLPIFPWVVSNKVGQDLAMKLAVIMF